MRYEFAVLYEQSAVGKAEVIREGLYYRITCRYRLPSSEVCRLVIKWPGGWENIGIPVPEGDGFILTKKIPVKKIQILGMTVHLIPAWISPDDLYQIENIEDDEGSERDLSEQEIINNEPDAIENVEPVRLPVFEDRPFDELYLIEKTRGITAEGQSFLIFDEDDSDLQQETNGAMVGAEDIGIDGSLNDVLSESV